MPDFTPRPTIYKGIQMRSRLEAGFAGWLDRMDLDWEYEPFAVGDERGQYLPDFLIRRAFFFADVPGEFHDIAVEVKPTASVIDFARLGRAAKQLGETGRLHGILLLVVADQGAFAVMPHNETATSTAELMRMVWCLDPRESGSGDFSALVTFAGEPPFLGDWWK